MEESSYYEGLVAMNEEMRRSIIEMGRLLDPNAIVSGSSIRTRSSVWPSREIAEIMCDYTEEEVNGMTVEQKQEYEDNLGKREPILRAIKKTEMYENLILEPIKNFGVK
jgi:hypothetical protein